MTSTNHPKPNVRGAIKKAIKIVGGKRELARLLGVAYQSMNRWSEINEMPATEFNGKTLYAKQIQDLTDGEVTIADLLGFVPHPQQWAVDADQASL